MTQKLLYTIGQKSRCNMKIKQSNFILSLEDPNQHKCNCAKSSIKDQEEARKKLDEIKPSLSFHIQVTPKYEKIKNN